MGCRACQRAGQALRGEPEAADERRVAGTGCKAKLGALWGVSVAGGCTCLPSDGVPVILFISLTRRLCECGGGGYSCSHTPLSLSSLGSICGPARPHPAVSVLHTCWLTCVTRCYLWQRKQYQRHCRRSTCSTLPSPDSGSAGLYYTGGSPLI